MTELLDTESDSIDVRYKDECLHQATKAIGDV